MFGRTSARLLRGFYTRPFLPFAIEFLLLAPLSLTADVSGMTSIYVLLLPWLLILLVLLNFPFVVLAFRSFKRDPQTRRNHALEHATILILEASGNKRMAGSASPYGFRVSGGPSEKQIRAAFEKVRQQLVASQPLNYISARCGSNRLMALGFALVLLFLVTILSVLFRPPLFIRAIALIGVVLAFTTMRHLVGNWLQKRLFMATDFKTVSLRDVRKTKTRIWEKSPTYFVETFIHEV